MKKGFILSVVRAVVSAKKVTMPKRWLQVVVGANTQVLSVNISQHLRCVSAVDM